MQSMGYIWDVKKSLVDLLESSGKYIYLRQTDVSPLFMPFPL